MRCTGGYRHWRVVYGAVGVRTPVCVRCGDPNPKPLTEDEWAYLIQLAALRSVGDHVRTAIEKRQQEDR